MIKAYLGSIPSLFEAEDIGVQYCVYKDETLLFKESVMLEYRKPAIVGHISLLTLLKKIEKYIGEEILIIVNDGALYEFVRGTSTTKNPDVLRMGTELRKSLRKFEDITIRDIHDDVSERLKWKEELQF